MNVFILNTGRCGSTTWIEACKYIRNYTASHESRSHLIGEQRLAYPSRHIEADNRLSWYLGRLDALYGDDALYVHLSRNRDETAQSFARRIDFGIMRAYREGILLNTESDYSAEALAHDYIETVESNIALFLKDKHNKINVRLESAKADFSLFWKTIGAEGELEEALAEFDVRYNPSSS